MDKPVFGLVGKTLTHSFSPQYFKQKFTADGLEGEYHLFEMAKAGDIKNLFHQNPALVGVNVTIPYKQEIIPHLHRLDSVALQTNSVNLVVKQGHQLVGYNSDVRGFELALYKKINHPIRSAIILGSGGASQSVKFALRKIGCNVVVISRTGDFNYSWLRDTGVSSYNLIVNTTPLGMFPNLDQFPAIPYEDLSKTQVLFDLIYNPEKTVFLKNGEQQGTTILNGMDMLHAQADKAYEILLYHFNKRS